MSAMWSALVAFTSRLRAVLGRGRLDDDAQRECDAHIVLLTERNIRAGMSPNAAQNAARRQFGNPTVVREDVLPDEHDWLVR